MTEYIRTHGWDTTNPSKSDVDITLSNGAVPVAEQNTIAGERNPSSATNGYMVTKEEANYTVVDVAADSTTISSAPAFLFGYYVNTVLSAHALPIMDGATTVLTVPASLAAGTLVSLPAAVRFETSLIADPNDAATGNVTFFWRPI